ncbi:universal stress protein [Psychromicrobium xiongbiense]|uniref:universal stress protein n=1 Tax=Psychromicrobium xiongbiense TaxID=3051184 RepID=UPI0025522BE2|nr:universal stress protein [Psychromicrobium sp. YIM S02556]
MTEPAAEQPDVQDTDGASEGQELAPPTGIVVGVDGSDHGYCALRWAVREAKRRQRPLHLVTAYSVPIFAASGLDGGFATVDDDLIRQGAQAVIDQAVERIADAGIDYDARIEKGDASAVLLEFSLTAELLVFGSRGRGGFVGRLLGSVSSALPGHAHCPTVTVPLKCAPRLDDAQPEAAQLRPLITVGVDGSSQSRFAVLVAAEEAQRAGKELRIICAVPPLNTAVGWLPTPIDRNALFEEIETQLDAGRAWLSSHFPGLPISSELVDGVPIEVLIESSASSELLVLGTRGHGGFAGMILGSTTDGVLHHARGPVMVVRDREDPRLADRGDFGPMLSYV